MNIQETRYEESWEVGLNIWTHVNYKWVERLITAFSLKVWLDGNDFIK
jgi:hypothetical protein